MRHDHTRWLTHFVRDRVPDQDFADDRVKDGVGGELGPDADAFSVLAAIIRLGGITPGYSFRNGRTRSTAAGPWSVRLRCRFIPSRSMFKPAMTPAKFRPMASRS